jgi:putative membrane protein
MIHHYWNDWYFGFGWVLWFGFILLLLSGFGNWGYTYRAHQLRYGKPHSGALDILDERYARSEISREQYSQFKSDILGV